MMPMQNVFAQRAGMPVGMQPPAAPPQMPVQGQAPMRPAGFDPRMGGMPPGGIQQGGPPMSGPVGMQGAPMQAQPMQQAQAPVQQPPQNFLRQRLMAM